MYFFVQGNEESDEEGVFSDITNTSTPIRPLVKKKTSGQIASVINSLENTNKLLANIVERLDKHEQRMEKIENGLDSSISSSSCSTPKRGRNKEVPLQVRVSVSTL